ncbi:thiol-disulfide oxidoreductase DCC family protein [Haloferula sargassicola]|uniref:DUF393 domain-containing protein n=1 Tax=Haloferula sargassicola TaxID=490096 RepID=A0ABP9USM5_9BACT
MESTMKRLTVFYDVRCGLCCRFRQWLETSALWVEVEFIGYDSPRAEREFPGLLKLGADRDCVVRADDGRWWQGSDAWLVCLWATREYRLWSHRLAAPHFRPWLETIVHAISRNRLRISALASLRSEAELAEALAPLEKECDSGSCRFPTMATVEGGGR